MNALLSPCLQVSYVRARVRPSMGEKLLSLLHSLVQVLGDLAFRFHLLADIQSRFAFPSVALVRYQKKVVSVVQSDSAGSESVFDQVATGQ